MREQKNLNDNDLIELLYQTYLYVFPLVVLELHMRALTNTEYPTDRKAPLNQLFHAKGVARAGDREIVHPNIDTVYTKAHMDLKSEPLYFHKPKTERYTAAEMIDAYGNCVAIIGNGGIGGDSEVNAVLVGPDFQGTIPQELVRIDIPTNLCWTLTRVLKEQNDEAEIAAIQQGFDLRPLSAYQKEYIPPKGTYLPEDDFIPAEKLAELSIEEFFSIANSLLGDNMGTAPDVSLLENAVQYGIGMHKKFSLSDFSVHVQQALTHFYERAVHEFDDNVKRHIYAPMRDNWIWTNPELAAFKENYSFRAKVAWGGFGANPVTVAIYPQAYVDSDGNDLTGKFSYICHFDSLPPVGEFWSLTVYGEDQFLIPNELDRNGINDRSDFQLNADGSLDIYLQNIRPSANEISNWLPVGAEKFGLVLRLYSPSESILNGTWQLPTIRRRGENKK
ncbi:MAG: DUF1214 domain-containing protein [Clostridia bacterium]|nr:DUF1214 domain-containing protein [Clostridia bacterium]